MYLEQQRFINSYKCNTAIIPEGTRSTFTFCRRIPFLPKQRKDKCTPLVSICIVVGIIFEYTYIFILQCTQVGIYIVERSARVRVFWHLNMFQVYEFCIEKPNVVVLLFSRSCNLPFRYLKRHLFYRHFAFYQLREFMNNLEYVFGHNWAKNKRKVKRIFCLKSHAHTFSTKTRFKCCFKLFSVWLCGAKYSREGTNFII